MRNTIKKLNIVSRSCDVLSVLDIEMGWWLYSQGERKKKTQCHKKVWSLFVCDSTHDYTLGFLYVSLYKLEVMNGLFITSGPFRQAYCQIMANDREANRLSITFSLNWLWNKHLYKHNLHNSHFPHTSFHIALTRPNYLSVFVFQQTVDFLLSLTSVVHHHYSVWLSNNSLQQRPFTSIQLTCSIVVFTPDKKTNPTFQSFEPYNRHSARCGWIISIH